MGEVAMVGWWWNAGLGESQIGNVEVSEGVCGD